MARANFSALDDLIRKVESLTRPDPRPVLTEWEQIIVEDNEDGVLAGTDCDGRPMARVTYRPVGTKAKRLSKRQRNGARNKGTGHFAGSGPHASGLNNNLSPAEYRQLGGPPLAPRGRNSRVITNLFTQQGRRGDIYFASASWNQVVSQEGVEFLDAHFTGATCGKGHRVKLPIRNLCGIRPQGRAECLAALQRWGDNLVRMTFT